MALKDHLTESSVGQESRCAIHRLRKIMPDDDRKELDKAIAKVRDLKESNITVGKYQQNAVWILKALQAEGYQMTIYPLQKHIRKDCGCGY